MSGTHEVSKARLKYPNGDRFSSCHKPSLMTMMIDCHTRVCNLACRLDPLRASGVAHHGSDRVKSEQLAANFCHKIAPSGLGVAPKKNNVCWAIYDGLNPVESSGIVGKNFSFDLRVEAVHRFETGNRVEFAGRVAMA